MKLKSGWLERQFDLAKKEIATWSRAKKEVFLCHDGHRFSESKVISMTQEIQRCSNCGKQRVKANWAEDWVTVNKESELSNERFLSLQTKK